MRKRMMKALVACSVVCVAVNIANVTKAEEVPTEMEIEAVSANDLYSESDMAFVLSVDGTLTISGKGTLDTKEFIADYRKGTVYPKVKVKKIIVNSGITGIAGRFFPSTWETSITEMYNQVPDILDSNVEVVLPDTLTFIGNEAFMGLPMTEIDIPNGVTRIGERAFSHNGLQRISIPESVTSIGDSAFDYSKLEKINLPNGITSISGGLFSHCTKLKEVTLPSSVTYIGGSAFYECNSLEEIVIPGSVKKLYSTTFFGCRKLKKVTLQEGVEVIENEVFGDTGIEEIVLPKSIKRFGNETSSFFPLDYQSPFYSSIGVPFNTWVVNVYAYEGTYGEKLAQMFSEQSKGTFAPYFSKINFILISQNDKIKDFVTRMYTEILQRQPDDTGLNTWVTGLSDGTMDGASLARGFICSDEFTKRGLSNDAYVNTLYKTFFNREPDAGGKENWMKLLNANTPRNEVLAGFVNSQEFANLCDSYGIARGTMEADGSNIYNAGVRNFVLRIYTKALKRDGETAGVEDWSHRINTKAMSPEDVAKSFFSSAEFINKNLNNEDYVETLYETFMGRASDAGGKADWVNRLNAGTSRTDVLEGFSRSQEFSNIMKSYGL